MPVMFPDRGRPCPRCRTQNASSSATCSQCGWIFEDRGAVRADEMTGYPGEWAWRILTYVVQLAGLAFVAALQWPGVVYVLVGWGLRRRGPTWASLFGLALLGATSAAAFRLRGPPAALAVAAILSLPLSLALFADEIGGSLEYVRFSGYSPGGAIPGVVLRPIGWALMVVLAWFLLTAAGGRH